MLYNSNPFILSPGYIYSADTGLYYLQSRYYDPAIGRFINADVYTSTGQGVLGNNMFAYCLNNPVNCYDSSGTVAISFCNGDRNPLFIGYYGCSGGGAGGYTYAPTSFCAEQLKKVKKFAENSNESVVQEQINTYGVSFYKGVPVFMTDLAPFDGTAFSLGIIVMDDYFANAQPKDFSDVLKHERGHTTHFTQIGVSTYIKTVAIPSLLGAGLTYVSPFIRDNYESLPWENIAEQFGGVNGSYLPGATTMGAIYWGYTVLVSWIT